MEKISIPSVRVLFDFRHRANKTTQGAVSICITYQRRRKYISTGVKVLPSQWDKKTSTIKNRLDAMQLNERIASLLARANEYVNTSIKSGGRFSLEGIENYMSNKADSGGNFIEFMEAEIRANNNLGAETKRKYMQTPSYLKKWGKMTTFTDVTKANALEWLNWLHSFGYRQQTVHSIYKTFKQYVYLAEQKGLIEGDPLAGIKVARGKSLPDRWLTRDELTKLESTPVLPVLEKIKDLFLIQCYTGLAFGDIYSITEDGITFGGDMPVLTGYRHKTGEKYTIPLLSECIELLKKYDYKLPRISLVQYNLRLKAVAAQCGIDRPVASHWGRRTCGMLLLNKGVPIEIVAKVLGHSDIRTTQMCYAKILDSTVVTAFSRLITTPKDN